MKKPIVSLAALISIGALMVAGLVGVASFKESQRSKKIKDMIASLEEQKKTIERENADLKEKIAYFETDDFRERTAKEKLNMQKPDEKVAVVKLSPEEQKEQEFQELQTEERNLEVSNPQKWLNHFFSYE